MTRISIHLTCIIYVDYVVEEMLIAIIVVSNNNIIMLDETRWKEYTKGLLSVFTKY